MKLIDYTKQTVFLQSPPPYIHILIFGKPKKLLHCQMIMLMNFVSCLFIVHFYVILYYSGKYSPILHN